MTAISVVAIFGVSCSPNATSPPYETTTTIKDIMDGAIDPSADYLWDSVAIIISAAGREQQAPKTDDEWKEAHRNAVRLIEATNLLMMPGRQVAKPGEKADNPDVELPPEAIQKLIDDDRQQFLKFITGLREAARPLLKATETHDAQMLFDSGDALDKACEDCHLTYWYPEDKRPKTAPSLREKK